MTHEIAFGIHFLHTPHSPQSDKDREEDVSRESIFRRLSTEQPELAGGVIV